MYRGCKEVAKEAQDRGIAKTLNPASLETLEVFLSCLVLPSTNEEPSQHRRTDARRISRGLRVTR
jgi:hypothetical protein